MRRHVTSDPPGHEESDTTRTVVLGDGSRRRPVKSTTEKKGGGGVTTIPRRIASSSSSPLSTPVSIIVAILVLLMVIWVSMIAYFYHNSIVTTTTSSTNDSQPAQSSSKTTSRIIQQYDGWQPPDFVDTNEASCTSWRKCFSDTHRCPGRCRDDNASLTVGSPPVEFDDKNLVPDVEMLHRMLLDGHDNQGRPWPPPLVTPTNKELCEHIGTFGGQADENIVLFDAVPIQAQPLVLSPEQERIALQQSKTDGGSRLPRILCMVYTMESEHGTRIRAIRETWAPGCDGFLAFSTKSDPRIPAVSIPHEGPEEYGNMWQVCCV
jgi:hypothetical protein